MKQLTVLAIFSLATILSACDNGTSPEQKTSAAASVSVDLKVDKWGPQSTTVGVIPNKQPGGGMGIWIKVSGTRGLGKAQVIFDDQPARITAIGEDLITAEIAPEQLAKAGKKEVAIKQTSTDKLFPVGVFEVLPVK